MKSQYSTVFIPNDYLAHINNQLPSHLSLNEYIAFCQRPLRRSIRVNTLKISVEDFKQRAQEKGWELTAIPWCKEGFWIQEESQNDTDLLGNAAEHLAGLFYIQEASSMLPVSALLNDLCKTDIRILDMAAAPGSKTTQIAALLNHDGLVVANEYSASRVKILHANQVRTGVMHCALTHYDARIFGTWLPETFDAILLDAPCSGEGTVRKDPKAFSNWSLSSVQQIASTQKELLLSAFQALKPNGTLVYSTCTLSREENQDVCLFLKERYPEAVEFEPLTTLFDGAEKALTEEGFLHVFPQIYDSEGFFVAKIRKLSSISTEKVQKKPRRFLFEPLDKISTQKTAKALFESYELSIPDSLTLWSREQEIWLFPRAIIPLLNELKFDRIGLKLALTHKQGYKWQHESIVALAAKQSPKKVEISLNDAQQWYKGQDIRPDMPPAKGEVVVHYRGHAIGIGKWVGNRIKNALPRELVKDGHLFSN